ncbi:MAG: hypothetical protein Alpg2KO_34450 [Alphaproteobacteria bacterium]
MDIANYTSSYVQWLAASDLRGDTVHWVLEDKNTHHDSAIQGVMTLREVLKEPCPYAPSQRAQGHAIGYLTNCYITPTCRNMGLGTKLLKALIADARSRAMELIFVWPSDQAMTFYRQTGFNGDHAPLQLSL